MIRHVLVAATLLAAAAAQPAAAQEAFGGVYAHEVDTPLSLDTDEDGIDVMAGYRFGPVDALRVIGRPQPYVMGSLNTAGDTSFIAAGLGWKLGKGPVYVRPGIGLAIHDGPDFRVNPVTGRQTDLGSRVLFSPEIAVGTRLGDRLTVEASWVHLSHARLFDGEQNPGLDMIGVRLAYALR